MRSCEKSKAAAIPDEVAQEATKSQVLALESLIVNSPMGSVQPRLFFNIELYGTKLLALLDSLAGCSYLGKGLSAKFAEKLKSLSSSAHIADGSAVPVQGIFNVKIMLDEMKHSMPFHVSDDLQYECILGIDFKRRFKLKIDYGNDTWSTPRGIVRSFYPFGHDPISFPALASIGGFSRATVDQQLQIEEIKQRLISPTPETLGLANVKPDFIDIQGHEPIRDAPKKYSQKILKAARDEVDRMLAEGIIEPSDGLWRSCPVLVPKSSDTFRFCIDYKRVNKMTKALAYPLRNMDDILDKLRSAKYISKLDLSQAYHQIPLDPRCREATAFRCQGEDCSSFCNSRMD